MSRSTFTHADSGFGQSDRRRSALETEDRFDGPPRGWPMAFALVGLTVLAIELPIIAAMFKETDGPALVQGALVNHDEPAVQQSGQLVANTVH